MTRPLAIGAALLGLLGACAPETTTPDLAYTVTVQSAMDGNALSTDCVDSAPFFDQTYSYELYFEGSTVEVKIDGESFGSGTRSGCDLVYESAVWLEERASGDLRWQLTGEAVYEGAAGGCSLDEGVDWEGDEVIEITESEDEDIPVGCTYDMVTEGTLKAG